MRKTEAEDFVGTIVQRNGKPSTVENKLPIVFVFLIVNLAREWGAGDLYLQHRMLEY